MNPNVDTDSRLDLPEPKRPSASNLVTALLPSAAFIAANQISLPVGILAASATSATVIVSRRRRNVRTGVVLWVSLAYVMVRAAVGVVTASEDIYFGVSLAISAATALVIGATAFTSKPVAARVIPIVVRYRARTVSHPLYRRVAAHTTIGWAAAELAVTVWEATHLTHSTGTEFVLVRTFVGWPLMALWICVLIFYVRLRLDPIEHRLVHTNPKHAHRL